MRSGSGGFGAWCEGLYGVGCGAVPGQAQRLNHRGHWGTQRTPRWRLAGRTKASAPTRVRLAMGQFGLVGCLSGFEGGEAFVDFVPVDGVPPGGEIFGTAVVVFQVVGVLPDVVAKDGIVALADGAVLIRRGHDVDFTSGFAGEPDPSAAELFDAGIVEFGLKIFEVAEGFRDCVGDGAGGIAAALGL